MPDLRALCGIDADHPAAGLQRRRGPPAWVDLMVEALPRLDGAHAALVVDEAGVRRTCGRCWPGPPSWAWPTGCTCCRTCRTGRSRPSWPGADLGRDPDPPLAEPRDRADHQVLRVRARPAADGRQRCQDHGRGRPGHRPGRGLPGRGCGRTSPRGEGVLADPQRYRAAYDQPGCWRGGPGRPRPT